MTLQHGCMDDQGFPVGDGGPWVDDTETLLALLAGVAASETPAPPAPTCVQVVWRRTAAAAGITPTRRLIGL